MCVSLCLNPALTPGTLGQICLKPGKLNWKCQSQSQSNDLLIDRRLLALLTSTQEYTHNENEDRQKDQAENREKDDERDGIVHLCSLG